MSIKRETDLRDYINNIATGRREVKLSDMAKQVKTGFTFEDDRLKAIGERLKKNCITLNSIEGTEFIMGILTGFNKSFILNETEYNKINWNELEKTLIYKVLAGKDIKRYSKVLNKYMIMIPKGWTNKNKVNREAEEYVKINLHNIYNHLINSCESDNENKSIGLFERYNKGDYWWELRGFNGYDKFERGGICYGSLQRTPTFCHTECRLTYLNTVYLVCSKNSKEVCNILNSNIGFNIYKKFISNSELGDTVRVLLDVMENMLIPKDLEKLNGYTDRIQQLKSENKDTSQLEAEVEKIVQELYGLTDEEVEYLCK